MSVNEQLTKLTFEVASLKGTVKSLIVELDKINKRPNSKVSLKPLMILISICFSGIFGWLAILTYLIKK